jgi:predicted nucleotidyltransferase
MRQQARTEKSYRSVIREVTMVATLDASERTALALQRAGEALRRLQAAGIRAWLVGSLAKGRFNASSDVDFVVDCPKVREYEAFKIIEGAMGDFPFNLVPFQRLREDAIPFMMEGALDASGVLSRQT